MYTQEGLVETLLRMIAFAASRGAPAADISEARIAAEAFRRAKVDVRDLKPLAESRRRSNAALAHKRYKPPLKADPARIRQVLLAAPSNKDAARKLRVSLRTITTYKKKYAQG